MAKKEIDKKQQNMIAIGILAVAVIFVFYKFIYTPMDIKARKLQNEITQKREKLMQTQQKAMKLDKLEAEFALLKDELAEVGKRLPRETRIPELVRLISSVGQKHGINISNLSPLNAEKKQYYSIYPFETSIVTKYHNLGFFLADMVQQERIITVKNLELAVKSDANKGIGVTARFILCAYSYIE